MKSQRNIKIKAPFTFHFSLLNSLPSHALVHPNGAHEQQYKEDQSHKPPYKTETLFDHYQHDDGDEENSGHFIPDTKLIRRISINACRLLLKNAMQ